MSRYRERPPHRDLSGPVACVWTQVVPSEQGVHDQRIVPDGCLDLVWIDGVLAMVGPDTRPRLVPIAPGRGVAGVRLRPGTARLLLGDVPASALRDQQVDLSDLWGPQASAIARRLAEVPSAGAAACLLEQLALARLPGFERDPATEAVVTALARPAAPNVRTLAGAVGISERQLRRRIIAAVGYGPKTLESVLRFDRARRLARHRTANLAELAAITGYADQAHLTREVRRLSGLTPRQLLTPR